MTQPGTPSPSRAARGRLRVDSKLVVTIVVMAALVGMYAFTATIADREYSRELPIASINSSAPEGVQHLHEYLQALGVDVRALEQFEPLPASGTIVIASDTFFAKPPSEADIERLTSWVEDGGRVVFAGAVALSAFDGPLLDGVQARSAEPATVRPNGPTRYANDVGTVSLGPRRLTDVTDRWVSAYEDKGSIIVTRRHGEGEVVVLASVYPLTNDGLGAEDNARFATLVAAAGARPVYFDEYHQGYARGGSMWSRLSVGSRTGLLLGLVALAVAIVARARRLGPAIPQADAPVARSSAYIGQLAEVYQRAGARVHSLTVLEDGLTRALRRRHGTLSAGLSLHADAAAVLERSAKVRLQEKIDRDEFVEVARALARARRDVEELHG